MRGEETAGGKEVPDDTRTQTLSDYVFHLGSVLEATFRPD